MDAEKENHPPSKLNNRWTASQKGEGRVTVKSISEREFSFTVRRWSIKMSLCDGCICVRAFNLQLMLD